MKRKLNQFMYAALVIVCCWMSSADLNIAAANPAMAEESTACPIQAGFDLKVDACTVHFVDQTLSAGAVGLKWHWDFGDGHTSSDQNPVHTYGASGVYEVCLVVVAGSADGVVCEDRICKKVEVVCQQQGCEIKANFEFKMEGCTVGFNGSALSTSNVAAIEYHWNFGDGHTSSDQNPVHTYGASGVYEVCLVVVGKTQDGQVCRDRICKRVEVHCETPCKVEADFEFGIDGCTAKFIDGSVAGPGTIIVGWHWNFGDGHTSSDQNPVHTYGASGVYEACIVVVGVNPDGIKCESKICKRVEIHCEKPCIDSNLIDPNPICPEIFDPVCGCDGKTYENKCFAQAAGVTSWTEGPCEHNCRVEADFKWENDSCNFHFIDGSVAGTGTTITNWHWSFGDGTTSTMQNPSHSYLSSGVYEVCLIIVGTHGDEACKDRICKKVEVRCERPCIDSNLIDPNPICPRIFEPVCGCDGKTYENKCFAQAAGVTSWTEGPCEQNCRVEADFKWESDSCNFHFIDGSVAGTGTTITNWHWSFGDGTTSTMQNPSHSYLSSGVYEVCLIIVGTHGDEACKDRICKKVEVHCEKPCIDSNLIDPNPICPLIYRPVCGCDGQTYDNACFARAAGVTSWTEGPCEHNCRVEADFKWRNDGCTVKFGDGSIAGAGTTITGWHWDFGDGNTSTMQNPAHTYTASGVYEVCLIIVGKTADGQLCRDRICKKVEVHCEDPCRLEADFKWENDSCKFFFVDGSVAGTGTTITNWHWNFGDGTTSTLQNPSHTYSVSGIYTVCLTIAGNNGAQECTDRICKRVEVKDCGQQEPCRIVANYNYRLDSCKVKFNNLTIVGAGTVIVSYHWNFGDGNTSVIPNPDHTYGSPGVYNVCLAVVGFNGTERCTDTLCRKIEVSECEPKPCRLKADFKYKSEGCKTWFGDMSVAGPGTTITNWFWDFGDGNTSTTQDPMHQYAAPGVYTVCLTIVGNNGIEKCRDQICKRVVVEDCGGRPCVVKANYRFKASGCSVKFADLSVAGSGTTITNWFWNFGDGNTSTTQDPMHQYAAPGVYTVRLTVIGNNGIEKCRDQICKRIVVEDCDARPCRIKPNFRYLTRGCTAKFFDMSVAGSGTTLTNWFWDFGDSTTSTMQDPLHAYSTPGVYEVCLTVVGNNGVERCREKICKKVSVRCRRPLPIPGETPGIGSEKTSDISYGITYLNAYPNPAQGITNIEFELPEETQVQMYISDIVGKRVLNIYNSEVIPDGYHKYTWEAGADIPAGIYIVTLKTATDAVHLKIIIER